jgi:hypothetical protein
MGFLWHLRRHNDLFSGLGCCRFIGRFVYRHFFVGGCFAFMFGVFRAMRYALCALAFAPCVVTFALCGGVSAMGFLEALWLSAACALASLGSARPSAASAPEAPSNANTAMDRKTGLRAFTVVVPPYIAQGQCNAPRITRVPLFGKHLVNKKILVRGAFRAPA